MLKSCQRGLYDVNFQNKTKTDVTKTLDRKGIFHNELRLYVDSETQCARYEILSKKKKTIFVYKCRSAAVAVVRMK